MKPKRLIRDVLIVGVGLCSLARVSTAQTISTLYDFKQITNSPFINDGGANPLAGLTWSDNKLFGTASLGGLGASGTIFTMQTNGTGFTNVYDFTFAPGFSNADGRFCQTEVLIAENRMYGVTTLGGASNQGTVFAIDVDGTHFTNLHNFEGGTDGGSPLGKLVLSGDMLYGTANMGGISNNGTIFRVGTDGTGFTNLHTFPARIKEVSSGNMTNSDGAHPVSGLVISGSTLYGTAYDGGPTAGGTIFSIETDGTGFTNLHSFDSSVGYFPQGDLLLSGDTLYGTTSGFRRTVFAMKTNGTGFVTLHTSADLSDGGIRYSGLILSGDTLFGTATNGGIALQGGNGTVFSVKTNGEEFTVLHRFSPRSGVLLTNSDGAFPRGRLLLLGRTLYGTTSRGGREGNGTIFSLELPPPRLSIHLSEENVVLEWPTNAPEFTLQSTTNLIEPVAWKTNPALPIVVQGQNTVSNPISGPQQFYRLSQ